MAGPKYFQIACCIYLAASFAASRVLVDAFSYSTSRGARASRPSQIILKASSLHHDDDTSHHHHQFSPISPELLFDPFQIEHTGIISPLTKPSSGGTEQSIISAERRKDSTPPPKSGLPSLQLSDVWKARLLLILAAALYGTNFTCVKMLDETVPVGISTTLRFALASMATLPWLVGKPGSDKQSLSKENDAVEKDAMPPTSLAAAIAGLEVGAWNSIAYISQAVGLESSDASKSAFICSLSVVVVPFLDSLAGKKLLPREIIGAAMAVAGVGVLELGGSAMGSMSYGDMITMLQPIFFGIAFWRMEKAMERFPQEAKRMTASQILAVFLTSAVYGQAVSADHTSISQIVEWVSDPSLLGALFWTGCVTTAFTLFLETVALATLSASETTMIFSTEPLFGMGFAALVAGEELGIGATAGAFLILLGCLVSNLDPHESTELEQSNANDGLKENNIPKSLLGPGLSLATPSIAMAAKTFSDLSTDASANL